MARKERIFTNRKRRVYRKEIPRGEVIFGAGFVLVLCLGVLWFASQKNAFDPGERDLSTEAMEESRVEDTLYRTPLQVWVDPEASSEQSEGTPRYRLGIFPPKIVEGGWVPSSRLQVFNEENLFEKINGAAPQYFQYGFRALHFISLKREDSDLELNLELYDMAEFSNAVGIFAAQRDDDQALEEFEDSHFYETSAGALGILGRFYFKITGNQSSSEIQAKTREVVRELCATNQDVGSTPKIYSIFAKRLKIPFERVVYERNDVFQYDFAHDFWFGRPSESSDLRLYAHEAASAEEAQTLFDQLLENHLYDFTVVVQEERSVVMKHNYLGTLLGLKRSGNFIYGAENAPDENTLNGAMNSMSEVLFDDE